RGICLTDSVISGHATRLKLFARATGASYWSMIARIRPSLKRWPALDGWLLEVVRASWGWVDPVESFTRFVLAHEFMVTGRYHAAAYCLALETPFVSLESNTPKVSSLLSDVFGNVNRGIFPAQLDSDILTPFRI